MTQGALEPWRKALGAYYTPGDAAHFLAAWSVRGDAEYILEPSLGDGAFVHAVSDYAERSGYTRPRFLASEINPAAINGVVTRGLVGADEISQGDFLGLEAVPVDAVIGNPPYVRIRALPEAQQQTAFASTWRVLGEPMPESGSVWMPFVLHASSFLKPGGRLALVLPWDMTYVRYARPLWRYLGDTFGSLEVVRVRQRLFPDISQDVLLLLADAKGRSTEQVRFTVYESLSELDRRRPMVEAEVSVAAVQRGERAFQRALLGTDVNAFLESELHDVTQHVRSCVDFHIGYVSGNKPFFNPDAATIAKYRLPQRSLLPTLTTGKGLRGAGLLTSATAHERRDNLWRPSGRLTAGEARYVADGEAAEVHLGYKASNRTPWYRVPDVRAPDLLLTAFAEQPTLMINDGAFVASNTLLCGFLRDARQDRRFAAAWYSPLTLLSIELEVHSLGGGVLIVVPREAGNIRVPALSRVTTRGLSAVDAALKAHDARGAYDVGRATAATLIGTDNLALVEAAIDRLDAWRTNTSPS